MEFMLTVCMAAIATALFRMLVPENKFSKQISLLIACVFTLAGISAVSGAQFSLDTSAYSYQVNEDYIGFSGEVNKTLQKKICKALSDKLYEKLNAAAVYPQEIHIIANISGLYSITISRVELVFAAGNENAAAAAEKIVSDELPPGTELKIIIEE